MNWGKKVGQYFQNATMVIFGLGWNWTGAKKGFLPRLKIEPRPYPLIRVQTVNPFHPSSSSSRLQPPFSLLSLSETNIHHNAIILLRQTRPLLLRASAMPSSPLPTTVVPPFLARGKLNNFVIIVVLGWTLIWPTHITLGGGGVVSWFSSPLTWFWIIIKDWLGLRRRLYWRISYGGGGCYGGVTIVKRGNIWPRFSIKPRQKGGFLPWVTPEAKSLPFFALALYVSILEPRQNSGNNRCQIHFLHWWDTHASSF